MDHREFFVGTKRATLSALLLCWALPAFAQDDSFCAPYQNVDVIVTPVFEQPVVNTALSLRALQQTPHDNRRSMPHGETVMLGIVRYAPLVQFNTTLSERPLSDGTFCARVDKVEVTMGYKDVSIDIANEFTADACAFNHVLTHEQKHIRVNAELLQEFTQRAQTHLSRLLHDSGVYRVANEAQADQLIREKMRHELDMLSEALVAENQRRQAMVDSPQEYATNDTACQGRVQAITRRALGR